LSHLLPLPERAQENASDQQPARAAAQGSAQEDQGGRAVPERGERATPGDGTPAAHPRELAGAALPRHAAALRAGAARRGSGSRRLSRPATPTPDSFTQKRLRHHSVAAAIWRGEAANSEPEAVPPNAWFSSPHHYVEVFESTLAIPSLGEVISLL